MNHHKTGFRLSYLDGLRALAALAVIFTHAFFCIWRSIPRHGTAEILYHLLFGHATVVLFLALFGFCLTLPISQTLLLKGGPQVFLPSERDASCRLIMRHSGFPCS